MTRLPVRTGADVHLGDALGLPGCPLCRERARVEAQYLESILAESVNDVGFRRELDAGRGFCAAHCRAVLVADRRRAGSLGAAILLRATLAARLRDLEAAHAAGGWTRTRRSAEAARSPSCPACRRVAEADAGTVDGLVRLGEDAAWAAAIAAAPFCLDHVVALVDRRRVPPWWPPIEARQLERLRALGDRLGRYAHASAHDRRHLQTADQVASVDEAADLLGGGAARASADAWAARAGAPVGAAGLAAPETGPEQGPERGSARASGPAAPEAVLVTGVYGAGKTTVVVEIADLLAAAGATVAAIDLDWLGWYSAPVGWDEHRDPRLTLANLSAMREAYVAAGVRHLVLAGVLYEAPLVERLRAALGMPLWVVVLEATPDLVTARLAGDPNRSRADDLAVALERLAEPAGDPVADWTEPADRPVGEIAASILRRLGWPRGDGPDHRAGGDGDDGDAADRDHQDHGPVSRPTPPG